MQLIWGRETKPATLKDKGDECPFWPFHRLPKPIVDPTMSCPRSLKACWLMTVVPHLLAKEGWFSVGLRFVC